MVTVCTTHHRKYVKRFLLNLKREPIRLSLVRVLQNLKQNFDRALIDEVLSNGLPMRCCIQGEDDDNDNDLRARDCQIDDDGSGGDDENDDDDECRCRIIRSVAVDVEVLTTTIDFMRCCYFQMTTDHT